MKRLKCAMLQDVKEQLATLRHQVDGLARQNDRLEAQKTKMEALLHAIAGRPT
jgi:prefoldin subunit 5